MDALDKATPDLPATSPDPKAMYETVIAYAADGRAYRAGTRLRGNDPEVRARFASGHWMLASLDDSEKDKVRAERMWAHTSDDGPPARPDDPIAQPPSGRFQALRSWTLADPDLQHVARINAGDIVDADDEVYRRFPHLFTQYHEDR